MLLGFNTNKYKAGHINVDSVPKPGTLTSDGCMLVASRDVINGERDGERDLPRAPSFLQKHLNG